MRNVKKIIQITLMTSVISSCSTTSHLALLSDGNLENKNLQSITSGETLTGKDCWWQHNLSDAFRNAITGTEYDTLIDVNVTTKSNVFVFYNCVEVEGKGVKSSDFKEMDKTL